MTGGRYISRERGADTRIITPAHIEFRHGYDQLQGEPKIIMQDGKKLAPLPRLAPPPVEYDRSEIKGSYGDVRRG